MRRLAALLRTISGRIVLGFVVLLTTFGVVAGYTIWQMNRMGERLRFTRAAYMENLSDVAFLQYYSDQAADAIDAALSAHGLPSRARLLKNREDRRAKLTTIDQRLAGIEAPNAELRKRMTDTSMMVEAIGKKLAANEAEFQKVSGARDVDGVEDALKRLRSSEMAISRDAKNLLGKMQTDARQLIRQIEANARYARWWSLALGALATFVAILVALWAVLTLRPLARLAEGARRVARGDYRGRVAAQGGTEVAELAKEFNTMAQAIEEREQELVRSARLAAVGRMAAVITHEVRNPLSSIGLNGELLEEELGKVAAGGSADEARALLAAMQKEVDRLTAITEEYLRFARLPRPKLEREQVNDIAQSLVTFQREELAMRGVTVEAELAPDLPPVMADEAQIRQALLNLVRNAADAMDGRGGTLRVSTARAAADTIEVRVSDTGPGIAEDNLARIFEPFFSTKEGGTGLGLALTQQIILDHGGRIGVSSTPAGTTFVVSLPAAC